MSQRPRLLFVAPWFLFPRTTGGRIRTSDILKGMKGGAFEITLLSPDSAEPDAHRDAIETVCDRFLGWPQAERGPLWSYARMRHLFSALPVAVATDRSPQASALIAKELGQTPDVVVIDFPHTAVLTPDAFPVPSVLFTHNVEAEIFERHAEVAGNVLSRAVWRNQFEKMKRFERRTLARFDHVVAVADRDRAYFEDRYGQRKVTTIPTGVDLDYFGSPGEEAPGPADKMGEELVFTGSMDWMANIDAITFFMDEVWPNLAAARPGLRFTIVGRNPPKTLVEAARQRNLPWTFTGFVKDVRPYVHRADVYVIPLRVGGGTRLKVYEAMAMGCPMVSTAIGVEGLPLEDGAHYLRADAPQEITASIIRLLDDEAQRRAMAARAHDYVSRNFSAGQVAKLFEDICLRTAGVTAPRTGLAATAQAR